MNFEELRSSSTLNKMCDDFNKTTTIDNSL